MNTTLDFQQLIPAWKNLQSIVPIAHIESAQDYHQATLLLNSLLDTVRDDKNHPPLFAGIGCRRLDRSL